MLDLSLWDLLPLVTEVGYHANRTAFTFESDTYLEWALLAVDEGRFAYEVGPERGEAGFGEYVLCPPRVALVRRALAPMAFYFTRFYLQDPRGRRRGREDGPRYGRFTLRNTSRLASDFSMLRSLHPRRQHEDARNLSAHVVKDLLMLPELEAVERPRLPISDPVVAEARRRLDEEFGGEVSLRGLAAELGLRPVQLTRRFTAAAGQTPLAYLTFLRLEKARALLSESDLSLESIARECGYASGFYLSRLFTAKVGMSPSAFRKGRRV